MQIACGSDLIMLINVNEGPGLSLLHSAAAGIGAG